MSSCYVSSFLFLPLVSIPSKCNMDLIQLVSKQESSTKTGDDQTSPPSFVLFGQPLWWRHHCRCLLGTFLFDWRTQWKDFSYHSNWYCTSIGSTAWISKCFYHCKLEVLHLSALQALLCQSDFKLMHCLKFLLSYIIDFMFNFNSWNVWNMEPNQNLKEGIIELGRHSLSRFYRHLHYEQSETL